MEPKDKALELITKFEGIVDPYNDLGRVSEKVIQENAKEAALIAVEEIVYQYFVLHTYLADTAGIDKHYKFWLEVKEELNKS